MRMRDAINDPGQGSGSGDDRYGFDEAAGCAWVIDGATDVGAVRLFPEAESDAAWLADALSTRFLSPPAAHESPLAYFADVVGDVADRLTAEAAVDIASAPRDSWPTASFIWLRVKPEGVETVRFGDCLALVRGADYGLSVFGDVGRADQESRQAAAFAQASWEDKLPHLRAQRAGYNTPGVFVEPGGTPSLMEHLVVEAGQPGPEARALLMSDGLYRLVAPFGAFDHQTLLNLVEDLGLAEAITRLRALERAPDGPARFKAADDATGLLVLLD